MVVVVVVVVDTIHFSPFTFTFHSVYAEMEGLIGMVDAKIWLEKIR